MNIPATPIWQQALRHVPGAESNALVNVQALAGGTTNATFQVQTPMGRFVVRLNDPACKDFGVNRKREAILHASAAAAGLASCIVAADPAGRFLITEFLGGAPWQPADCADLVSLAGLAQTLNELHSLAPPVVAPLDLMALLQDHVAKISEQDGVAAQDLGPQLARAQGILGRLADTGRVPCIVHGDLTHSNMIGVPRPQLIDWEYAAVADPLLDLACLTAYYPQLLTLGNTVLRSLGLPAAVKLPQLEELSWVYRLLSDLWYHRLTLARRHPRPAH